MDTKSRSAYGVVAFLEVPEIAFGNSCSNTIDVEYCLIEVMKAPPSHTIVVEEKAPRASEPVPVVAEARVRLPSAVDLILWSTV